MKFNPGFGKSVKIYPENLLHASVYCCLGLNSYFSSKSVKSRFVGKWPIFTVSTVFQNTNVISDAGFVFSVKIYPGIRTPYAFLSLFSGGTATSENFEISKSRGLVILTTGHIHSPERWFFNRIFFYTSTRALYSHSSTEAVNCLSENKNTPAGV